ncbi:MAG TPA: hypothetical protein VHB23_04125 [Devosiaceae bacterium]|nr:hypothetical protein [Devosiaceae bacterium]
MTDEELEIAADGLRAEAEQLLDGTGLRRLLADRFGAAALTGSCRYDLMVWRDIDIHVPLAPERRLEWAGLLPEIGRRVELPGGRMQRAQFLDDYVDPHPLGAGLYWGVELRDANGFAWKIDLWGWAPDDFERRQAADQEFRSALEEVERALVLRLKTEARQRPDFYGAVVSSMDVYRFVLAGAGRSLEELLAWKSASGA